MTKGYLIDPFAQVVTEVEYQTEDDVRALLGVDGLDTAVIGSMLRNDQRLVRMFMYVGQDAFYVRRQAWFRYGGYVSPVGGKALLVASTPEGADMDPHIPLDLATSFITWLGEKTPPLPDIVHYPEGGGSPHRIDQNAARARHLRDPSDEDDDE